MKAHTMKQIILSFPFLLLLSQALFSEEKPNIVFIFIDDQGYYDLG